MVNFIKSKIRIKRLNIKKEVFDGIGFSIILLIICMLLIANIARVVRNGVANYRVYLYEKNLLLEAKDKNEQLKEDLKYYSSEETKKLLARDVLNLAEPSEELYTLEKETRFYEKQKKIIKVDERKSWDAWWHSLIKL